MDVIRDGIMLCSDCMIVAVNGDTSGIDEGDERKTARKIERIYEGLRELGPNLVPAHDSETGEGYEEFSSHGCDCCGSRLAGSLFEFAVLG
jgi:hypothetical protein